MKILKREKIAPIYVGENDTIQLDYVDGLGTTNTVLKPVRIGKEMVVDEALVFRVESGDFEGAVDGFGGAFLSSKEQAKEKTSEKKLLNKIVDKISRKAD